MRRYAQLLVVQLKASVLLSLQYRLDFFIQALMTVFWSVVALVPLWVLLQVRPGVAGWTGNEALLVVGFFTALKGVLTGVIQPALGNVVEHIRKGTLDFLLLKPADAQFMLSTSRFDLARVTDVLTGAGIVCVGLWRAGIHPSLADVCSAALLTLLALVLLYALWILVVSLAFYVVKIDNLSYLIVSTFDAARWPSSVFRGVLAFLFTFVIPLTLMTTYPALALLGRLTLRQAITAVIVALVLTVLARRVWLRAIRAYTGAGG